MPQFFLQQSLFFIAGCRRERGTPEQAACRTWTAWAGEQSGSLPRTSVCLDSLLLWCKTSLVQKQGGDSQGSQSCPSAGPSVSFAGSVESLSHTTSSPQPSPAASTHASRIADPSFSVEPAAAADAAAEETPSESGSVFLPDYLFLSNCESGKLSHNR